MAIACEAMGKCLVYLGRRPQVTQWEWLDVVNVGVWATQNKLISNVHSQDWIGPLAYGGSSMLRTMATPRASRSQKL